jgi:hypothetical protein
MALHNIPRHQAVSSLHTRLRIVAGGRTAADERLLKRLYLEVLHGELRALRLELAAKEA